MAAKINWHRCGTKLHHCHPVSSLAGKAAALRRSCARAAKKDRQNQVGVPQSQNHWISPILYWKFWWEQISAKPHQILARLWTRKYGKGSPLCIVKFAFITYSLLFQTFTSLLWHCWLGVRKSIRSEKMSDEMLVWLSVWSEVQTVCIWSSWCHHLLPYLNPDWFCLSGYRLTQVVLEKRPLNGCSGSSSFKPERWSTTHGVLNSEILKNFIFRVLSNVLAMHVSGTALRPALAI